jgi:hypothetical protein
MKTRPWRLKHGSPLASVQTLKGWAADGAFTRADLIILLATLTLLMAVAWPGLATPRARNDRLVCFNNLRQIGAALLTWGGDHGDRLPWEVEPADGGTRRATFGANAWYQFAAISNELRSPKVLLCPSDTGPQAQDFSNNPDGGLLYPTFGNNSISYFLGHPYADYPRDWLATDRNLRTDVRNSGCSFFPVVAGIYARPILSPSVGWTNNMHVNSGNLLTRDGRVEQLTSEELRRGYAGTFDDNGTLHFLVPR